MGQFIETQSQLVSEAKQARLEREQKRKDKERKQKQELELFFTFDNILHNSNEEIKKNELKKLSTEKNRDIIINKIITEYNINDIYNLTIKYDAILNKAYKAYMANDNTILEEQKEQKRLETQQRKELMQRQKELKKELIQRQKELKKQIQIQKDAPYKQQAQYILNNLEPVENMAQKKNNHTFLKIMAGTGIFSYSLIKELYKPQQKNRKR